MRRPINNPYTISGEFGADYGSAAKFRYHSGVDYALPVGREVYAPISGTVTSYTWGEYHGNVVQIFDGQFYHRLMHNSEIWVKPGQAVVEGQLVARSGATGKGITGPHVHWDICKKATPTAFSDFVSPADWLAGKFVQQPQPPQGGTPMTTQEAQGLATALFRKLLRREPDAGGLANYTNHIKAGSYDFAVGDIANSQEFKNANTVTKTVEVPVEKIVTKEVVKEVDNPALVARVDELGKAVDIKQKEIDRLNSQLATQGGDTELLNGFGQWLTKLIQRLGLRK